MLRVFRRTVSIRSVPFASETGAGCRLVYAAVSAGTKLAVMESERCRSKMRGLGDTCWVTQRVGPHSVSGRRCEQPYFLVRARSDQHEPLHIQPSIPTDQNKTPSVGKPSRAICFIPGTTVLQVDNLACNSRPASNRSRSMECAHKSGSGLNCQSEHEYSISPH